MNARIVKGSMGSFLNPPGSAQYNYHVEEGPEQNPSSITSLRGALDAEWYSDTLKQRVRELLDASPVECDEDWLRQVYTHFQHCYSPDGENRNASDCIIDREDAEPFNHHLAVLYVRQWFPDHEARTDLIHDPDL